MRSVPTLTGEGINTHTIVMMYWFKYIYRTTPNFKKVISSNNTKILNGSQEDPPAIAVTKKTAL